MIREYKAFIEAFQAGKAIQNAVQAKNWAILGNATGALLVALSVIARGFGYGIPVSDETMVDIGKGVFSVCLLVNGIVHTVTSEKVGIKRK